MADFTASIYALAGSTITVRIRDNSSWWTGTGWSVTIGDAYAYATSVKVTGYTEDFYYVDLSLPTAEDGSIVVEYLRNGIVIGEDIVTEGVLSGSSETVDTSTTGYNPTLLTIVKGSLRMVGAYASTDQPRPDQLTDAIDALQLMLKAWQSDNLLWLRRSLTITPVVGTATYTMGPTGTGYTGSRPTRIFNAYRRNSDGYDVPLAAMSRQDYNALTNKSVSAPCVQYYFNPQLGNSEITFWPVPDSSVTSIILDCDRVISDILHDLDTFDVPPEWWEVIKYGLAWRIAPEYGLDVGERTLLLQEYQALREHALSASTELVSTFFAYGRQ